MSDWVFLLTVVMYGASLGETLAPQESWKSAGKINEPFIFAPHDNTSINYV